MVGMHIFHFPMRPTLLPPPAVVFYHFINSTHLQLEFAWRFWLRCHKSVFLKRRENPEVPVTILIFLLQHHKLLGPVDLTLFLETILGYHRSLYSPLVLCPDTDLLVYSASYLNPCRKHLCFITFAYTLFISFKMTLGQLTEKVKPNRTI